LLSFRALSFGVWLAALAAAGCGDGSAKGSEHPCLPPVEAAGGADDGPSDLPPADVSGDYTVTLTNLSNTCVTETDWIDGAVSPDNRYDIRQDGATITAQGQGNAAVYFVVLLGSNDFSGSVKGDAFRLTDVGPYVKTDGSCSYTIDAIVSGSIDGDTISGTITYRPVLSADPSCNPDCAPYACEAVQAYVGTRAPR
jgi:hypothetical protein